MGFSKEDRDENVRRIGFVANLLSRNGVVAIVALVSPYRCAREEMRQEIGRFVEVYVKCDVAVCADRDVKGMYAQASRGKISNFTGVSGPYEAPLRPEVVVETDRQTQDESILMVLDALYQLKYVDQKSGLQREGP